MLKEACIEKELHWFFARSLLAWDVFMHEEKQEEAKGLYEEAAQMLAAPGGSTLENRVRFLIAEAIYWNFLKRPRDWSEARATIRPETTREEMIRTITRFLALATPRVFREIVNAAAA
jgi:hypothetical protein